VGIGDWGWGIGPNPQSPIPNPQSPIPKQNIIFKEEFNNYKLKKFLLIYIFKFTKKNGIILKFNYLLNKSEAFHKFLFYKQFDF